MSRSAAVVLPGMSILAAESNALHVDVADSTRTSLAILTRGKAQLDVQGKRLLLGAQSHGAFVPAGSGPQHAYSEDQNVLMVQIDRTELETVARAVLGVEEGRAIDLGFQAPRLLSSENAPSLLGMARQIGAVIDLYGQDSSVLHRIGFQDFVYRQLVLHLKPDWQACLAQEAVSQHKERLVHRVCDQMLSDISRRYTLSELALIANMSVRSLQYAFQSRFGQSPMAWLMNQRLDRIRRQLRSGSTETISQLALGYGFASASSFSAFYRRRFGESPIETRTRRS